MTAAKKSKSEGKSKSRVAKSGRIVAPKLAGKPPETRVFPAVGGMDSGDLDSTTRNFAWAENPNEGYSDPSDKGTFWECWEALRCDKCGAVISIHNTGGDERHNQIDEDSECEGWIPRSDGPVMGYFCPTNSTLYESDAELIVDLPLCVVKVGDATGFALTGGGMDLTDKIVEAFMLHGHLPPVYFAARIADSLGGLKTPRDKWILAGCKEALRRQIFHLNCSLQQLKKRYAKKK